MRPVPGDPLTGQLPATQALPARIGPARRRPVSRTEQWPYVPDKELTVYESIRPGLVANVRTRRGIKSYLVRTVNRSRNGRRFITGMDRKGMCHSAWLNMVISVETKQQHLKSHTIIEARVRER